MLLDNILSMDNEELYSLYLEALEHKNLPVINVVRSVVADRFSLKALRQSPLDDWKSNPEITRFFSLK